MEVDKDNEIVSLVSSSSECKKEAASQSGKRLYPFATESILNDSIFAEEQLGNNSVALVGNTTESESVQVHEEVRVG